MPDETDKPLANLADAEAHIDPPAPAPAAEETKAVEPEVRTEPEVDPNDPQTRLRAFEDRVLGEDVVRIDGKVERGIGSKFSLMDDVKKAEHAALERLIEAEQKMVKIMGQLDAAKTELATAQEAADAHGAE